MGVRIILIKIEFDLMIGYGLLIFTKVFQFIDFYYITIIKKILKMFLLWYVRITLQ